MIAEPLLYTLTRDLTLPDGTGGKLAGPGIERWIYTAEDPVREPLTGRPTDPKALVAWVESWKVKGKTAMPRGTYDLAWTRSNRLSKAKGHDVWTLELLNVPAYGGIRIHSGNDADDTDGCILPGLGRALHTYKVTQSRAAIPFVEDPILVNLNRGFKCRLQVR